MYFDCRKFIKFVNDVKDDREIDKKNSASNASKLLRTYIDAKSANSSFSDLTKICQKIRSISMRKNQIFSVFFDRVFALQNRVVMIA